MTSLPLEILRSISQYLSANDLKQFQLVSKEWHEASIESLYCKVVLKSITQVISYIRAISNSHKLGIYLKTIDVCDNFQMNKKTMVLDTHDLLNTLINHCPNLREIRCQKPHLILWTRLMLAANKGKLLNLQRLPSPFLDTESVEPYACTALLFKNSLTSLELTDHASHCRYIGVINRRAFNDIRSHIKEFPKLQELYVNRYCNQPFNHLDSIIDDCPNLIDLKVRLFRHTGAEPAAKHDVPGLPRPDIRSLTCSWQEIVKDDQLKYIMRKFPNLQSLFIRGGSTSGASYNAMMEFIQYMLTIPNLKINANITKGDLTKYWNEFLKLRNELLQVNISYMYIEYKNATTLMEYSNNLLNIELSVKNTDTELPHFKFLKQHEHNVKSLTIKDMYGISKCLNTTSVIKNDIIYNENWFYQTLRVCPYLQELTLKNFIQFVTPGDDMPQHTELKKLSVYDENHLTSLEFLKKFSTLVPNLKQLFLFKCYKIDFKNMYRIEIDMPNTSFDLITVKFEAEKKQLEKHYIKLNTIEKERYFVADQNGTQELTCSAYQQSRKSFVYIINCQALKQFKLIRDIARPISTFTSVSKF